MSDTSAVVLWAVLLSAVTLCACESGKPAAGRRHPRLAGFYGKLEGGGRVTVAYFGGSITWGATATDPMKTSYRALVSAHLEEKYPEAHIKSVDAAVGGQPSKLGVFRIDRDVLPYKPDLTFVEFAVNDTDSADTRETMEGIVRKLSRCNPQMAIVVLIIGSGWENYGSAVQAQHRELAEYYGLPFVDVCGAVQERIKAGLSSRDVLTDLCHPSDNGYRIYTEIIVGELARLAALEGTPKPSPEKPLTENRYESAAMIELSKLPDLGGWKAASPTVTGTWFDQQPSRWQSSAVTPGADGAVLTTTVECTGLGLYYEITSGGGPVVLKAKDEKVLEVSTDTTFWEARVMHVFEMLGERKTRRVEIAAPGAEGAKPEKTKVAYLLVTR
jgi:lysophospholipase L1-like esterase